MLPGPDPAHSVLRDAGRLGVDGPAGAGGYWPGACHDVHAGATLGGGSGAVQLSRLHDGVYQVCVCVMMYT